MNEDARAGRPGVCRVCGAIVGAGESNCAVCNAPLAPVVTDDEQARRDARRRAAPEREAARRFARAILLRPAPFTLIILIANIFLFLLMWQASGMTGENLAAFPPGVLIAFGAKLNSLIAVQHEWWRFVTPMFLHVGIIHLFVNMYGLWMIGPMVERLYGSAKFVVFWVVTGVAGVVASYLTVRPETHGLGVLGRFLFKNADVASAGASGALFGLIGVLFVFGIKFRHELPADFKSAFGTGMLPTILINIFIGYSFPFIDNAAHMGGLLTGALLAAIVHYERPGERAGYASFLWRTLQTLALALVIISFAIVARRFNNYAANLHNTPAPNIFNLTANNAVAYVNAINNGVETLLSTLNDSLRQNNTTNDAARFEKLEAARKALDSAPHLDDQSDAVRDELKTLLERARAFENLPPAQRRTRSAQTQLTALVTDIKAWQQRFDEWVTTDGRNFGLKLIKRDANQNQSNQK